MLTNSPRIPDAAGILTLLSQESSNWMMAPEALQMMMAQPVAFFSAAASNNQAARNGAAQRGTAGAVAVIPVSGPIMYRGNWISDYYGLSSIQGLQAQLREALADPAVKSIVFQICSPGGTVYGVSELAAEIMAARDQKTIVAIADPFAASAAYWLGTAASEFVVMPSGEVGSIGVWTMHVDYSEALKMDGVKVTLISAGEFKVEGNPYEPLDDVAKADMQQGVDDVMQQFIKDVAKNRGKSVSDVRANFGKGRMVSSKAAVAAGMADRVGTMDTVLSKLGVRSVSTNVNAELISELPAENEITAAAELAAATRAASRARELALIEVS